MFNLYMIAKETTHGRKLVWQERCLFQYAAEHNSEVRVKSCYHAEAQILNLGLKDDG